MTTTHSLASLRHRPDMSMAAFGLVSAIATVGWFTLIASGEEWSAVDELGDWTTRYVDSRP